MAHFRATIQGNRGPASRCGQKHTGIHADINGWRLGIHVDGYYDADMGRDVFEVWKTTGSASRHFRKLIGKFSQPPTERNRNE